MVTIDTKDGMLILHVKGLDKLWSMKKCVEVPLASIQAVERDEERARNGPEGTRNPGTSVPGNIHAGPFNAGVKRSFWDVHDPRNAIRITLKSAEQLFAGLDGYDELVVEVADPAEAVERIMRACASL